MQVIRQPKTYDVCIVGSGAGGGMAAKVLSEAGADLVLLEAGPMWDSAKDSKMSAWPYESPRRGAATPSRPFGEFDGCLGGWDIEGEPYTQAAGSRFDWFRGRMLGGRTNHWGRISLRMGPDDFKGRSIDGLGDDWPITYDEIKPYYDKLDRLVGIFGSLEHLPNEPDGVFLPAPKPRCHELLIKQAADRLNIRCIPNRLSILTRPLNGRPACHYCGQCGRGCATHANFSSPSVLLPPALETGKLRIITNAMAREVLTDERGLATGVSYVNRSDRRDYAVRARIVVLAASACETARLLLNSKSGRFPDGLANSSGVVGRYLTDSTGLAVSGHIPKMEHGVPHNEDGTGGAHLYMPWWLDNKTLDFPRGYHIELGGGKRSAPGFGVMGGIHHYVRFFPSSIESVLGTIFAPLAWLIGVPGHDIRTVGNLLGSRMVINELYAYSLLGAQKATLDPRSFTIATFALCGFANFSSIGIQLGGIGALAPNKRQDLARLGFRAMLAGTAANLISASIVGILMKS